MSEPAGYEAQEPRVQAEVEQAETQAQECPRVRTPIEEWKRRAKQRKGLRSAFAIGATAISVGSVVAGIAVGIAGAANAVRKKNKK